MELKTHLKKIASLGGKATLKRYGVAHLRKIAARGGEVMRKRGSEYFRIIRSKRHAK